MLALLVQPWLGSVENEAVLESVLATERPLTLVESACRNALGLPPTATIPLQLPLGEPSSRTASESDPNASTENTIEREAWFSAVPAQLRWTYDAATACAARRAAVKCHTSSPEGAGRDVVAGVTGDAAPGVAAGASKVLWVVQADPGMPSRFSWWPAAAAALWQDVLGLYPHRSNSRATQSGQEGILAHKNRVAGVEDIGAGGAGNASVTEGATLNKHDVALLLQRAVMVAMVRCWSHVSVLCSCNLRACLKGRAAVSSCVPSDPLW